MKLDEFLTTAKETMTVKRVYAEPIEKDGVLVIPAATVGGGAGGGQGHDKTGQDGEGGGFGAGARPAGAYTVSDGNVRWVPAVDVNRFVATLGAVAIVFLITRMRIAKLRAKAAEAK
ncbi:spore germination protein GerW family protein [Amycolatopsis sp. NPDC059657]|uniref:spore germination protein GerW family protein n=1 Tax=Amycolatopsis sp. NPDC059657 TaxID=3346899 RepID=UPI00366B0B85